MALDLRSRMRDDDGISLVEILVAVVIIGIALGAFASTLAQSLTTITRDEQLVRGNQLAADLLEGVRAIDWETVGFYADDPGYRPDHEGAPTVTLGTTRPAASAAPRLVGTGAAATPLLPTATVPRDGIDYVMTLDVVWRDDPSQPPAPAVDPDPNDYKELRVSLDWTVRDRSFQTSSVSVRQPTLEEVPVEAAPPCTPGTITALDISPNYVQVSTSGITQQDITVTVETCTAVSQVRLYPTPLADFNMTVDSSSGSTFFSIDPFRAGVTQFDPGTYTWRAVADGPDGTHEAEADVTFYEVDLTALAVVDLTTSTADVICATGNGSATPTATTLTAQVTGAAPEDQVTMTWTSQAGSATAGTGTADGSGNVYFSALIPEGTKFNKSETTISVSVTRTTSDDLNVTEAFVIPIQGTATGACA